MNTQVPKESMFTGSTKISHFLAMVAIGLSVADEVSAGVSSGGLSLNGAPDENKLTFLVGDEETYDSNLYRLPSGFANIASSNSPNAARDEWINSASLGTDDRWSFGRQSIGLSAQIARNRFANNTELDNTSGNGSLRWNWLASSSLSGDVAAEFRRAQASFNEQRFLGRDLVDSSDYYADARYQVGPRWAVYGGVRDSHVSESAAEAKLNDFRSESGNAGVEYAIGAGNTVSAEYRYSDATFPGGGFEIDDVTFNRSYDENVAKVLFKYAFSEKTSIDASTGYLKRTYPNESFGAFSGGIWRVGLLWAPTDKTVLNVSAWHELQAYLASESDYFLSHGISIGPSWAASVRLTLTALLSRDEQNYLGSSPSSLTLGSRDDRLTSEEFDVSYIFASYLTLTGSYRHEQRSSNLLQYQYTDQIVRAGLVFKF